MPVKHFHQRTISSKKQLFTKSSLMQDAIIRTKGATPKELLHERAVNINPGVLIFKPVLIDTYYRKYKDIFKNLSDENIAS